MTYTVQNGDTLASIAVAQNLYARDLAGANGLAVGAELEPGQELELPVNAEHPAPDNLTPSLRTDAALDAYTALQARLPSSESSVVEARSDLDAAVGAELRPHIYNVPPYVTGAPSGQDMIDSFRATLLARHAGDPAAQRLLGQSINAFQSEYRADVIAQSDVHGSTATPQDRLEALGHSLAGEPPDVVRETLQQPSVQRRIDAAAEWIAEPYRGASDEQGIYDSRYANEASQRLADITANLPPELAAAVVERSLPTIERIAGVEVHYSSSPSFENVSRAVGALGDGPQAHALTQRIAEAYAPQVERLPGLFLNPNGGIVSNAVGNGAHPALAIQLAEQLNASGKTVEAGALLRSAANGAADFQNSLHDKVEAYGEHTEELNGLIQNAAPNLTPEQRQQAIDAYIEGQGEAWRNELKDLQQEIVADADTLMAMIGALGSLPPGIAELAPDIRQTLTGIGTNETTQDGLQFALSLDPSILDSKATAFLADVGQKGSDLLKAFGNAYVTGHIMPAISKFNPLDPASVSRVNAALDKLQTNGARLLGIPQHEIDAGVQRLRGLADTLSDPRSRLTTDEAMRVISGLGKVQDELKDLKNTTFSTGAAAVAFRTLALGMSGAALLTTARATIDDPSVQGVIGTLAYSVGLAQDASAFGATVRAINAEGRAGAWGLGASKAGQFTTKFVGVLNAAYFAAGAVDQYNQGSWSGFLFNTAGAGGALLATFGSAAWGGLGGPIGVAVMIAATGGVFLVQRRQDIDAKTDAAEEFYRDAGVDPNAIAALSNEAAGPAKLLREALDLSPEQMQTLAADHPEIFDTLGNAGTTIDVLNAHGVEGGDVSAFLDAARSDDADYVQHFYDLKSATGSEDRRDAQILRAFVESELPSAAAVARGESPDLYGAEAETREQATGDYEVIDDKLGNVANIGNLLASNDDPVYQAEIIRLMHDDGILEPFVHVTGNEYAHEDWPESVRSGIEAAHDAGVLSDDEAQAYLGRLPD